MRTTVCLLLLAACAPPTPAPPPLEALEPPVGQQFLFDPPVLARGTQRTIRLDALRSAFFDDEATLSGAGVDFGELQVLDAFNISVQVEVDSGATLGPRDVELTLAGETFLLPGALSLVDEHFSASPTEARMGEVVQVQLEGVGTAWARGTTVEVGRGVQTLGVEVLSPTSLRARLAIASDALPGTRDLAVIQGGARTVLYDGFLVDRVVVTASFSPRVVSQGETVAFTLDGVNTRFAEEFGPEQLAFWRQTSPVADFTVTTLERVSEDRIQGTLQVSNAALPGRADVFVDSEADLLLQGALEVLPVAPDPADAVLRWSFDVRRTVNAGGSVSDSVNAFAWFVVPLDPPCSSAFAFPSGPLPFNLDGIFESVSEVVAVDCPEPLTVSAGPTLFLESPSNVVTLHREVTGSTGQIVYRGRDLTLADYHFGQSYDLRASGDPAGVPAFLVPDAQPTVPVDLRITQPALGGGGFDRFEPLTIGWTQAGVYPTGLFAISLEGSITATGAPGYVGVIPFDDGQHTFSSALLSQMDPGQLRLRATVAVEGRVWQLPLNGRNHQGVSRHITTSMLGFQ